MHVDPESLIIIATSLAPIEHSIILLQLCLTILILIISSLLIIALSAALLTIAGTT